MGWLRARCRSCSGALHRGRSVRAALRRGLACAHLVGRRRLWGCGPRRGQYALHVQTAVGLDDDARVGFARDDLGNVEPIGSLLIVQAQDIQSLPIDEIVVQGVVDGVQVVHVDIAREEHNGLLFRAIAKLRIAAQPAAAQRHGCMLPDIRLKRGQVDIGDLEVPRSCGRLRRHLAVRRQRSRLIDASLERDTYRLRQIEARPRDAQRQGRQRYLGGRASGPILGRDVRIGEVEFMQFDLPGRARGGG